MQWSLFLLILMGQCSFFTCHLYEYHFIKEEKTWYDAQKYCRAKHTDLATVYDMTDMRRLRGSAENQEEEAWIGLYKQSDGRDNRKWHWSLPGVEFNESKTMWRDRQPNDQGVGEKNCVQMNDQKWQNVSCSTKHKFLCYDESQQSNKTFHLIDQTKTWLQAQDYCRENHTDLISGLDQLEELQRTTQFNADWMTIGLFRDSWKWSDESHFSFRNWDQECFTEPYTEPSNKNCAMSMLNRAGRWSYDDCGDTKSFFCYDDKVILIKQNKTWEESLYYCREKHNDLVSITNLDEQRWVQERAKKASTDFVWLGLRYTCTLDFWFWVSDESVNYKNWASNGKMDDCDMSGAMDRGGVHKWFSQLDNEKFNFMCSKC